MLWWRASWRVHWCRDSRLRSLVQGHSSNSSCLNVESITAGRGETAMRAPWLNILIYGDRLLYACAELETEDDCGCDCWEFMVRVVKGRKKVDRENNGNKGWDVSETAGVEFVVGEGIPLACGCAVCIVFVHGVEKMEWLGWVKKGLLATGRAWVSSRRVVIKYLKDSIAWSEAIKLIIERYYQLLIYTSRSSKKFNQKVPNFIIKSMTINTISNLSSIYHLFLLYNNKNIHTYGDFYS